MAVRRLINTVLHPFVPQCPHAYSNSAWSATVNATGVPRDGMARRGRRRAAILTAASALALTVGSDRLRAAEWDPFPSSPIMNDFGGVGLLQTPTARVAPDGNLAFSANRVSPYERYAVTAQALPWLEGTLRYSSIGNRLYSSVPDFSGDQSFKDRGFDLKILLFREAENLPAVAIGVRDFLGTGIFQSEYIVANKQFGPVDVSLGMGWGQLGTRSLFGNPLGVLSSRFKQRPGFAGLGGTVGNAYFKGPVGIFGGARYDTPLKGLTAIIEYDSNNYQQEALGNRFRVRAPVNVGVDYQLRSWLHVGASWERGNRLGLHFTMNTNLGQNPNLPKSDPPAPQISAAGPTTSPPPERSVNQPITSAAAAELAEAAQPALPPAPRSPGTSDVGRDVDGALAKQGTALIAAQFEEHEVTLFVAQGRYRNMATGLGRVARSAFSVLPERYRSVRIVFVESGLPTMSVRLYRHLLADAVNGQGSLDELLLRTEFAQAPAHIGEANYVGVSAEQNPRFYYGLRPALRTTLGRPEQFILYQAGIKLNGLAEISPQLHFSGSIGLNLSDNFSKLKIRSDSVLPHVRSDIDQYLKYGRTYIQYLQGDYKFDIAPALYGHVYGGILEEMFAGVGGEVMYRPYDSNFAVGADLTYARQRKFNGFFGLRKYGVLTGFMTASYSFPKSRIIATVRAGRYLAKDIGATFKVSRTFKSGSTIGAFATFTNVSAAKFGEGSFDKGLFFTMPLDLLFTRHVRDNIGLEYRPLIRDGGQQLIIRETLLNATGDTTLENFRHDWQDLGE